MIIMFIFLGLTIVFIIGTAIYLNKSKKQNGFTQNTDRKENRNCKDTGQLLKIYQYGGIKACRQNLQERMPSRFSENTTKNRSTFSTDLPSGEF